MQDGILRKLIFHSLSGLNSPVFGMEFITPGVPLTVDTIDFADDGFNCLKGFYGFTKEPFSESDNEPIATESAIVGIGFYYGLTTDSAQTDETGETELVATYKGTNGCTDTNKCSEGEGPCTLNS